MDTELLGFALTTFGEIIIGISVIRVHLKMELEHKIDQKVILEMHKEKAVTAAGIILISVGFLLQFWTKYY